jgi:hypothetical protein
MCGRSYTRGEAGLGQRRHRGGFFGLDAEKMSSGTRIATALSVLVPVVLSGFVLVAVAPGLWWIFTTYFWITFPAFGLLVRGVTDLSDGSPVRVYGEAGERELLRVLGEHGEITPAVAAAETSLTVEEADRKLRELAGGGHLEVRVRGGGIFYSLWEAEGRIEGA